MKSKRRKLLIDRPVQLGMVARMVFHWLIFLTAACVGLPLISATIQGDITTPIAARAAKASADAITLCILFVMLLPYFIYDAIRLMNRFAGPMYRLHTTMREVGHGAPFRPIQFRKGDFWHEVAEDFNAMVHRLENSDGLDAGGRDGLAKESKPVEQEEAVTV